MLIVEQRDPMVLQWWPLPGAFYENTERTKARDHASRTAANLGTETRVVKVAHPTEIGR